MIEAFTTTTPPRRPHDPARPQLVPPIAAGSRDPVVKELIPYMAQLYERRNVLRNEYRKNGKLEFPAMPEMLSRPRRKKGETPADFERRRSERMESKIRLLLASAACCNWRNMEIMDPSGGYLSVHRLAELAELPYHLVAPKDDDAADRPRRNRRFRMDTAERALRDLRESRIVCFTKQHREQLPSGRHTTTAPALRKLSVHFFQKFGGSLTRTFDWWRDKIKKTRGRNDRRERGPSPGVDIRVAEQLEQLARPISSIRRTAVPPAPTGPRKSAPTEVIDAVAAEHPDWQFPDIMAEALRRAADRGPPTGGAGALTKTE